MRRKIIVFDRIEEGRALTLREVAERLGVTPQRVNQLERSALKKLRRNWRMRRLFSELVGRNIS